MRAIRVQQFGAPAVLQVVDVPMPVAGPGQVRVRMHAIGVNPVDTYIRSGAYARLPALPYTPGTDGGGVVESVGAGVSHVSPGQRVYVAASLDETFGGAYQEHVIGGARFVHPIPDHVTFAQAAGVGVPYCTAYRSLHQRAHGRPGETVLVHGGSGGVGLASIQLARAHGMTVVASASTERGRTLMAEQGAHLVVDHSEAGYLDAVMAFTGGRGVDVILEMLANVNLAKDLPLLAMRGRVVVIGSRGDVQITPRQTMAKDSAILGMALWNTPLDDLARIHAAIVAGLANRSLSPVVGREFPLGDAPAAHEAVMTAGAHGKVVLLT
ncbi:MAG: NADPH:quinone reductase [Vicinamibacterales bacterium]